MSCKYAIEVNELGKCYQIYSKPSDRLKQMLYRGRKQCFTEFWALKDICLKIKKGETVGIIGRNGSGKSTLLQTICGTLNPTLGNIKVNGRIAALLELGAGFNPEFTGLENVYMAASLYGLNKEQISARMGSIVRFADIGDHIQQPVKTYSSGMYVRLAFAVIAHVDADILIIDEALSVGDAVFTQKCMRFLRDFMKKGTLLFVSHDLHSVSNLCESVIWINQGKVECAGPAKDVVNKYSEFCAQEIYGDEVNFVPIKREQKLKRKELIDSNVDKDTKINFYENIENSEGWKTGGGEIRKVTLLTESGKSANTLAGGEKLILKVEAVANKGIYSPIIGFFVKDRLGQSLFGEHTYNYAKEPLALRPGERVVAEFAFKLPLLPNGDYSMTVSIAEGDPHSNVQHHWIHDAVIMKVYSNKLRYGLVGVPFESVVLTKVEN